MSSSFSQIESDNIQSQIANDLLSTYNTSQNVNSNSQLMSGVYLSEIEAAILRSTVPISINESEEITVLGQRGIWANKLEAINWKGFVPLSNYAVNQDENPEIITKRTHEELTYIQELAVRYLRPPTPPAPGEIVITQEANTAVPPAPPVVIRQAPPRPPTPEPLVLREAPPQPPVQVGRKVITISGKKLPPPPRKVVIERLAPLPSKPQAVIIERWLPYSQVKRRVIFQKPTVADPVVVRPRNVIVQWETPNVTIKKEIRFLGTIRANPVEYVQRYGPTLKTFTEFPDFVNDIRPPQGIVLAADYQYNKVHELEGELDALRLVDLEREGLSEYRSQLEALNIKYTGSANVSRSNIIAVTPSSSQASFNSIINDVFGHLDEDRNGFISLSEAQTLLLRLNTRLGRSYGENEVIEFFRRLDRNGDGQISLNEFRQAFERI